MGRHHIGVRHAVATARVAPLPPDRATSHWITGLATQGDAVVSGGRRPHVLAPLMMQDEDPIDLEPLGDFLDSTRAPEACMDLSELDGFLAGLAVGPDPVLPEEWLPMVWDDEDPEFEDQAEADLVLGTMFARYNEIADGLNNDDPGYDPVYWQDATGRTVVED